MYETVMVDVLVIGGGGAASRAAIEASKFAQTAIVVDGVFGRAGTTTTGMGGMNVALGNFDSRDNWKVHYEDTIKGGQYLNNQDLVEVFAKEAIDRIYDLEQYGMLFYRMGNGRIAQRRESGSTYNRTCMTGDRTGHELQRTLAREVWRRGIQVLEETVVAKLLVNEGKIAGAIGLNFRTGQFILFRANAVVMATGGCARLYGISSNAHESTGDGFGLAFDAGATLIDMEMVQFHPTGMVYPESAKGILVSEGVRGDGGQLINSQGERFMLRYSPEWKELATRDVVSRSIWREVKEGRGTEHGGVYLNISHVPAREIEEKLPMMLRQLLRSGIDIRKEPMEVLPTPHFSCGGIKIDVHGATTLEGLFAAGEAGGGIHGANRLGANSFPDLQVFGARAGESSGHYAQKNRTKPNMEEAGNSVFELTKPLGRKEGPSPISIRKKVQRLLYQNVGIMREKEGLGKIIQSLEEIRDDEIGRMRTSSSRVFNYEWLESIKIRNMLQAALVIAKCALFREESRGVHYREDFPETDQNWWVNVNVKRENGDVKIFKTPVVVNKNYPVIPKSA
jgi:succinate dehydrogenase/fumarate reductase flavoprotein subunit